MPFFKPRESVTVMGPRTSAGAVFAASLLPALLVGWSTLHQGLPALRHDWSIPYARDALGPTLAGYFQPWLEQGIGSPQPYPTFYLLGFLLWPLHFFFGSTAVAAIILTAAVAIGFFAAFGIANSRGASTTGSLGVAVFAALNPWVYCEYVAGHIFMVLAYALLLALLAEISRRNPREWMLVILASLLVTQIEFFVLAIIPFSIWCVRRHFIRPLALTGVAAIPIIVGISALFSQILATPYNLSWQIGQSVPLYKGWLLLGYQFNYGAEFDRIHISLIAYGIIAFIGMYMSFRDRRDVFLLSFALLCLIFSTGTTWAIAPIYRFLVLNATESGIFRELYDLIAIVAIGYVVALGAAARYRPVAAVLVLLSLSLALPWLSRPVSSYLVNGATIPSPSFETSPKTRVALFPAFQPIQFHQRGSGYDPDAYVRTGSAVPINEPFPSFPAENALAAFANRGDVKSLSALSVSQIIVRPYLNTDWPLLREQVAFAKPARAAKIRTGVIANPLPLLAAYPAAPAIVSIGNSPTEYAVFVGDDPAMHSQFHPLAASRETTNPAIDWVDARLAYASHPEWGTAFGGVATTSGKRFVLPPHTVAILGNVSGHLLDDRLRSIASTNHSLHWIPTGTTQFVTCHGLCMIALATDTRPWDRPEHAWSGEFKAVHFRQIAPWLVAVANPNSASTLRYNVAYSPFWVAFEGTHVLPHSRLDESVNVWTLSSPQPGTLYVVNTLAAAQIVLEFLAFFTIIAAAATSYYKARKADPES